MFKSEIFFHLKLVFYSHKSCSILHRCANILVCVCVLHQFQQFFSHTATVSGCYRKLNAIFYRAASVRFYIPKTLHEPPQSHYTDTGATSPSFTPKNSIVKWGATSTIFNDYAVTRDCTRHLLISGQTLYLLHYQGW